MEWNEVKGSGQFVYTTHTFISASLLQVDTVDEKLLTLFSFTSRGVLGPMAAVVGGFAAQEVLKALTGKFSPLNQFVSWLLLAFFHC